MTLPSSDWIELLRGLNAASAKYLVVGAHALGNYGAPRATLFGGVPVHYIGRAELITNKRASGRAKDLADIEALESGESD